MNEIIKSNGVKFGIILGVAGILSQMFTYVLGTDGKLTQVLSIFFWFLYLGIRIFQVKTTKLQMNNLITFKEVFTSLFICILNGILISQLFTFLFMNYIDAEYGFELNKFMNNEAIKAASEASKMFGAKLKSADLKVIADTNNFSAIKILQGTLVSILISSILNLILAAIFKSKTNPLNE